jgi:hypothetical protein
MRRLLAILMIAPLTGCGAHLHRPFEQQLAQAAADKVEVLDWDQAFALDRAQRDAIAERETALGRAYADARREAELLDILTEPVAAKSWAKLETRFVALAACMLDEPGTGGGRACRGSVSEEQRELARALLFDACPTEGCAWIEAVTQLRAASSALASQLASYDRTRGLAGLGDAVATPAQCPVPTRLPARLRDQGQALERACKSYDQALATVAKALPESSKLREAIVEYRSLAAARDDYRQELRLLVAELGSLRFDGADEHRDLQQQVAHYLELQGKYALALVGAKFGDFGDLALEGTLMITREHRAAIVRTLALLGATLSEVVTEQPAPAEQLTADEFRDAEGGGDPSAPDPIPPRDTDPPAPKPPRAETDPPPPAREDPPATNSPPGRAEVSVDMELIRSLGATLVPVFGETWAALDEQRRANQRGSLLLSAELERIQIDAMTRRLALAEQRIWLELALIETQLLALFRLRVALDADWIPAQRAPTPERDELERLTLDRQLAAATLAQAQAQLTQTIAQFTSKSSKTAASNRVTIAAAKQQVRDAQAAVDQADDAYHQHLGAHGAGLCVRQGSVSHSYERDPACVAPIERLVGLHAELVGVSLPRLESLDRAAARGKDEAALLRDQAGLEIRVTYVAAAVAALERFTAGGLEARDVAAIVGAVVGIGLGAAITAGVYIP